MEFSLPNHRSLISLDLKDAVISKMANRMEIKLLEAIFPSRLPTVGVF